MSEQFAFNHEEFSGTVRLFPVPNLVLFPHVIQPLHVFEPRYRALVEEALSGDRLVTMPVLAPGWEKEYEHRPRLAPVACLGRVASHHELEGGRYNILLVGLKRVAIVRELDSSKLFREALVEVLDDEYSIETAPNRALAHKALLEQFKRLLPTASAVQEQLDQLLSSEIPLGVLTDVVAYTLDLEAAFKEQLLCETNVDRRAAMLLRRLAVPTASTKAHSGAIPKFPPDFSTN